MIRVKIPFKIERNPVWYVVIARACDGFLFHSNFTVRSAETLKLSVFTTPRRPPNKFVRGRPRKIFFSFWKSGVPRPVTGSQPFVAYPNPRGQYEPSHISRKQSTSQR